MDWIHKRAPKIYFNADTGLGGGGAGTSSGANDPPAAGTGSAAAGDPPSPGTGSTAAGDLPASSKEGKADDKTNSAAASGKYTEEDITKLKADFEKQLQTATTLAAEEAAKKAQMKPEEKTKYEQEQRLAELEKRERETAEKELRLDTLGLLAEKKLDKDFLDYVIGTDKDSTSKKVDAFKSLFDKAVQTQVETRLAGKTPPAGSSTGGSEADSVRSQFKSALGGY